LLRRKSTSHMQEWPEKVKKNKKTKKKK